MQCNDHYTKLAASMFNVPCSQVTAEMRRVAKSRMYAAAYQPAGGSYTARISGVACEGSKVEVRLENVERVASMCQDDAKRADEYEKLLLKAFPVVAKRRERLRISGPLTAEDFRGNLNGMCSAYRDALDAIRGEVTPSGPLRARIYSLIERMHRAETKLRNAQAEIDRLREQELNRLRKDMSNYCVSDVTTQVSASAAKDTLRVATFAATIAGGIVGSVLMYLLV
ncbi:DNA-binding protein [Pseudomonas phage JB10]|uniref:DNA-binding protein n=1 Tax=Pseudomonas phage JB10 TaxID=3028140 RepID=A0AAF0CZE8_9CAUD|nr:DNA-binding protein [Pseudomonas phage JB10]